MSAFTGHRRPARLRWLDWRPHKWWGPYLCASGPTLMAKKKPQPRRQVETTESGGHWTTQAADRSSGGGGSSSRRGGGGPRRSGAAGRAGFVRTQLPVLGVWCAVLLGGVVLLWLASGTGGGGRRHGDAGRGGGGGAGLSAGQRTGPAAARAQAERVVALRLEGCPSVDAAGYCGIYRPSGQQKGWPHYRHIASGFYLFRFRKGGLWHLSPYLTPEDDLSKAHTAVAGSTAVPTGRSLWSWAVVRPGGAPTREVLPVRVSELLSVEEMEAVLEAAEAEAESQIEAGVDAVQHARVTYTGTYTPGRPNGAPGVSIYDAVHFD
jgi:hypothetical protein